MNNSTISPSIGDSHKKHRSIFAMIKSFFLKLLKFVASIFGGGVVADPPKVAAVAVTIKPGGPGEEGESSSGLTMITFEGIENITYEKWYECSLTIVFQFPLTIDKYYIPLVNSPDFDFMVPFISPGKIAPNQIEYIADEIIDVFAAAAFQQVDKVSLIFKNANGAQEFEMTDVNYYFDGQQSTLKKYKETLSVSSQMEKV